MNKIVAFPPNLSFSAAHSEEGNNEYHECNLETNCLQCHSSAQCQVILRWCLLLY